MISIHLPANFYYHPQKDLMRLILSGVSRRIAVILLHLFSPVYIFITLTNFGYSKTLGIIFVLFYYVLSFSTKLIAQILAEDLSRKYGFKSIIRLSLIPFFVLIPALVYGKSFIPLFLLASVSWGLHAGLFWWGYHGYFVKKGSKKHFGESMGEADLLETTVIILTPLAGAFLVNYFGFNSIFVISSLFMTISILLLGRGSKTRQKTDVRYAEVLNLIRTHKSVSLAYIGIGGEAIISLIIWPLFLFLYFGEIVDLGELISLAALFSAVLAYLVGKLVDREKGNKIVRMGSPLLVLSWFVRFIFLTFFAFAIGDGIRGFGQRMVYLPLYTISYKKAIKGGSAKAILFLETTQAIGVIVALFALALIVLSGFSLFYGFVLAGLFALLPLIAIIKKRF